MASQGPREDDMSPRLDDRRAARLWPCWRLSGAVLRHGERSRFAALWGNATDSTAAIILWKLRIPRVVMAFLAGAALATSGMAFQAMFRNPLATPFTLGVASGASLGAAALHPSAVGPSSVLGVSGVSLCRLGRGGCCRSSWSTG